ncbi:MAG: hypothetical protein ABIY52_06605 [Gemmatimonadaceae bacterium]
MRHQLRHHLTATLLTIAAGAACRPQAAQVAQQPAAATPLASDAEIRDKDIEYFAARARRDPTGGSDLARLGALHVARGRETGDPRDAEQAEKYARQSLKNRPERNGQAAQVLQASLLAQHRFDEALQLALRARDDDPQNPSLRASVGEIEMELGMYDSARVSFDSIHVALGDPAVAPRLARWAELQGDTPRARRLLRAALATVRTLPEVPREQLAWYWLRIGDVEFRARNFAAADSAYRSGLGVRPDDYRLLSAAAHSALLQQKWQRAIVFGERAIAMTLDPATLGTLSDAYAATGDTARAAEYARVLDVVVLKQPGAYHRAWSLFLLDHDRHVAIVARKIREEMKTRKDVYAYDLLAWSLHKQGRDREAERAMALALQLGTKDPQLIQHAAAIRSGLTGVGNE